MYSVRHRMKSVVCRSPSPRSLIVLDRRRRRVQASPPPVGTSATARAPTPLALSVLLLTPADGHIPFGVGGSNLRV